LWGRRFRLPFSVTASKNKFSTHLTRRKRSAARSLVRSKTDLFETTRLLLCARTKVLRPTAQGRNSLFPGQGRLQFSGGLNSSLSRHKAVLAGCPGKTKRSQGSNPRHFPVSDSRSGSFSSSGGRSRAGIFRGGKFSASGRPLAHFENPSSPSRGVSRGSPVAKVKSACYRAANRQGL